jgi:hypothetical protein
VSATSALASASASRRRGWGFTTLELGKGYGHFSPLLSIANVLMERERGAGMMLEYVYIN